MEQRAQLYGVMGEFETAHQLLDAAEQVRDAGYKHMDAYAPFPVEGLSEALGLGRRLVPARDALGRPVRRSGRFWFSILGEYVVSYPMDIAGRPLNSWPAFIPVTFELTVLGAALSAVFGMIALNNLPQPASSGFQCGPLFARLERQVLYLHRSHRPEI